MKETYCARLRRLQREDRLTARALYGWNHPHNVEWARSRDISGGRSLREWCRYLEGRLRSVEERNRQRVADLPGEPDMPVAGEQAQALVIRRRGEGVARGK